MEKESSKKVKLTVVVIDASKLYQLARFVCKNADKPDKLDSEAVVKEPQNVWEVILAAQNKNYLLATTVMNAKRAWEAYKKKELAGKIPEEEIEKLKELYLKNLELLQLAVFSEECYEDILPECIEFLQDDDPEAEDSHALALARALSEVAEEVLLWTSDKDFARAASLGIKVVSKLI